MFCVLWEDAAVFAMLPLTTIIFHVKIIRCFVQICADEGILSEYLSWHLCVIKINPGQQVFSPQMLGTML